MDLCSRIPDAAHPEVSYIRQVMQYEATLKSLRLALESGNRLEAQRLMNESETAYREMAQDPRAKVLLQESKQLRETVNSMHRNMFPDQIRDDMSTISSRDKDSLLKSKVTVKKDQQTPLLARRAGPLPLPMPSSGRRSGQESSLEDGLQYTAYAQGIVDDGMKMKMIGARAGAQPSYSPFPKYNSRSRLVLQLRGGGDGDGYGSMKDPFLPEETAREVSGAIPIVNPTIAQKLFIMFDDDIVSISLVLGDCTCSFVGLVVKWGWMSLTSDIILYIMVFQQLLEIVMNSSLAKNQRMLQEGNNIRILDRIHASTYNQGHHLANARGGAYLLPGSTGHVFVIRERTSDESDEGAFIKLDGVPNEMYFVPWYEYKHLEIVSGLGDYLSNPLNIFNICLLILVVAMPYIDKGAKGIAVAILVLRIFKPVLKIYSRKLKLDEAGEKTGLTEEGEEGEEKEREGEEEPSGEKSEELSKEKTGEKSENLPYSSEAASGERKPAEGRSSERRGRSSETHLPLCC